MFLKKEDFSILYNESLNLEVSYLIPGVLSQKRKQKFYFPESESVLKYEIWREKMVD